MCCDSQDNADQRIVDDVDEFCATAADLLPQVGKSWLPALEADLPLEYMPFAVASLRRSAQKCHGRGKSRAAEYVNALALASL